MKAAREAWFEGQPELDPGRLIFIDESGLSTKMARLGTEGRALPSLSPARSLANHDLRRRSDPDRALRADVARRSYGR